MTPSPGIKTSRGVKFLKSDRGNRGSREIKLTSRKGLHSKINYVDEDFDQMFKDQMHCCDDKNPCVFLTKREHDQYMSRNDNFMLEIDDAWIGETNDVLSWEMEEFKKGYQNAIMQFQKKYNLGRKEASIEPQQTNPIRKPPVDSMTKDVMEKPKSKEEALKKTLETSREAGGKEVEKVCPPFNFEHEMDKLKSLSHSMNLSERVNIGRRLLKC
jgi:hypothetical protein